MNPGPIDETAKSAIAALKNQPMVLALLIFNLVFIALLAWQTATERRQWSEVVRLVVERCAPPRG